jgi:hypothetical protein
MPSLVLQTTMLSTMPLSLHLQSHSMNVHGACCCCLKVVGTDGRVETTKEFTSVVVNDGVVCPFDDKWTFSLVLSLKIYCATITVASFVRIHKIRVSWTVNFHL